jgi:hypothetical protein
MPWFVSSRTITKTPPINPLKLKVLFIHFVVESR